MILNGQLEEGESSRGKERQPLEWKKKDLKILKNEWTILVSNSY